jgi:hypothetical protein
MCQPELPTEPCSRTEGPCSTEHVKIGDVRRSRGWRDRRKDIARRIGFRAENFQLLFEIRGGAHMVTFCAILRCVSVVR